MSPAVWLPAGMLILRSTGVEAPGGTGVLAPLRSSSLWGAVAVNVSPAAVASVQVIRTEGRPCPGCQGARCGVDEAMAHGAVHSQGWVPKSLLWSRFADMFGSRSLPGSRNGMERERGGKEDEWAMRRCWLQRRGRLKGWEAGLGRSGSGCTQIVHRSLLHGERGGGPGTDVIATLGSASRHHVGGPVPLRPGLGGSADQSVEAERTGLVRPDRTSMPAASDCCTVHSSCCTVRIAWAEAYPKVPANRTGALADSGG